MRSSVRLIIGALTCSLAAGAIATAQQPRAGDDDDQIVITGCVMRQTSDTTGGPRSLLVWSKGNVYLDAAVLKTRPSETGGIPAATTAAAAPIFYWIDDEDDFARHVGRQVEIVGELGGRLTDGEFEVEQKDGFTEIEIDVDGQEAKARVPSNWLGPQTAGRDSAFDITVRRVDVEKVTVVGACGAK